mgnify:CR=1 FL=1
MIDINDTLFDNLPNDGGASGWRYVELSALTTDGDFTSFDELDQLIQPEIVIKEWAEYEPMLIHKQVGFFYVVALGIILWIQVCWQLIWTILLLVATTLLGFGVYDNSTIVECYYFQ